MLTLDFVRNEDAHIFEILNYFAEGLVPFWLFLAPPEISWFLLAPFWLLLDFSSWPLLASPGLFWLLLVLPRFF